MSIHTPDPDKPVVLAEYTFPRRGPRRPSRSGGMGVLLTWAERVTREQRMAHHATRTGHGPTDDAADIERLRVGTAYFQRLLDAGYGHDTTWDELEPMLRPLVGEAGRDYLKYDEAARVAQGREQQMAHAAARGADFFLAVAEFVTQFWSNNRFVTPTRSSRP